MDLAEWTGLLQLSDNSQRSDYNFIKLFVKNKAVTAPITFEKIVMIMIRRIIETTCNLFTCYSRTCVKWSREMSR